MQISDFAAGVNASADARHWVAGLLERWELEELVDNATLVTSELVTNAFVHARSEASVTLAVTTGMLEIGVSDRDQSAASLDERMHGLGNGGLLGEGGRGLFLVEAIADEWGTTSVADGKQIWARLSAHSWAYRSACQCATDHPARVQLASGAYALHIKGVWDSR